MLNLPVKALQYTFLMLYLFLVTACGGVQTLRGVLKQETPHEKYTSTITRADLHNTALGRSWIEAGKKALQDSVKVTLPFKETGYFAAGEPRAATYLFEAQRGEKVVIKLETRAREKIHVFMDLYEEQQVTKSPRLVAYADTLNAAISYEVQNNGTYLLRLQPELLRSGQYTVTITVQPTLAFPVPGKSSRQISSIWGDPRDSGARRHEGVDIFAPRGTPAIAASAGYVRGVSTTPRGGKVVWVLDPERRQSLYYAHLDSQLVTVGQQVQVGDTIGLIGNTGNARSTAPHLHFGIYSFGKGATNPYPYLHQPKNSPPAIKANLAALGSWRRSTPRSTSLRLNPTTKGTEATLLPKNTPFRILAATDDWFRVRLPDGLEGYIAAKSTEDIVKPIRQDKITVSIPLLDEAHPLAAPKDSLAIGEKIDVLANFKNFSLVNVREGGTGWIVQP